MKKKRLKHGYTPNKYYSDQKNKDMDKIYGDVKKKMSKKKNTSSEDWKKEFARRKDKYENASDKQYNKDMINKIKLTKFETERLSPKVNNPHVINDMFWKSGTKLLSVKLNNSYDELILDTSSKVANLSTPLLNKTNLSNSQKEFIKEGLRWLISQGLESLLKNFKYYNDIVLFFTVGRKMYKIAITLDYFNNIISFDNFKETNITDRHDFEKFKSTYNFEHNRYFDYSLDVDNIECKQVNNDLKSSKIIVLLIDENNDLILKKEKGVLLKLFEKKLNKNIDDGIYAKQMITNLGVCKLDKVYKFGKYKINPLDNDVYSVFYCYISNIDKIYKFSRINMFNIDAALFTNIAHKMIVKEFIEKSKIYATLIDKK